MPAISFSTLRDKLEAGEKKQTIRPLKTHYWLQFKKGDPVYGYWKMRTKESEKLFESKLSQDPFVVDPSNFTQELMQMDGFKDRSDAIKNWFYPTYGPDYVLMNFVVLRWE